MQPRSCDPSGKPFNPARKLIAWNGSAWAGTDIPDYKVDEDPALGMGPFIMNPEGVGRFFARGNMVEGPFPEHYEPFETPIASNPLSPGQAQSLNNPAARVFKDDRAAFGKVAQFPHVATTYRLTEHFHYWTKHVRLNAILQPEQFVGDRRQAGERAGDQWRGPREGVLESRLHQGRGGGHETPAHADGGRQAGAHGGHSDSLGIHRSCQTGVSGQHADAGGRRRQLADPGIQVLPREGGEAYGP